MIWSFCCESGCMLGEVVRNGREIDFCVLVLIMVLLLFSFGVMFVIYWELSIVFMFLKFWVVLLFGCFFVMLYNVNCLLWDSVIIFVFVRNFVWWIEVLWLKVWIVRLFLLGICVLCMLMRLLVEFERRSLGVEGWKVSVVMLLLWILW